jgi:hypothetical protein
VSENREEDGVGLISETNVDDFLIGTALLGTGGVGSIDFGLRFLKEDLVEQGYEVTVISPDDVPNDGWVFCTYMMGSIAPLTDQEQAELEQQRTHKLDELFYLASDKMLASLEIEAPHALVPVEVGAANSSIPLAWAGRKGVPVVDGDYAGNRANPEASQCTTSFIENLWTPAFFVDQLGGEAEILCAPSGKHFERMARSLCVSGYGLCGVASLPMSGKTMRKVICPGAISNSLAIGRTIREAIGQGEDPAVAVAESMDGFLLFRGTVSQYQWSNTGGSMMGSTEIEGSREYSGSSMRIWFKNENHLAWRDDKLVASSPDLISVMESQSGTPLTNDRVAEGQAVSVIGLRIMDIYRTEKAIATMEPRHFGFDIDYVPIEVLNA